MKKNLLLIILLSFSKVLFGQDCPPCESLKRQIENLASENTQRSNNNVSLAKNFEAGGVDEAMIANSQKQIANSNRIQELASKYANCLADNCNKDTSAKNTNSNYQQVSQKKTKQIFNEIKGDNQNSQYARNLTLESNEEQKHEAIEKKINTAKKIDLKETDQTDPMQREKFQYEESIDYKIDAANASYKRNCTPQHPSGTSFKITTYPSTEPCGLKNNTVYWSKWVPIGNNIEMSYVPLTLRQDRMYNISDGAARIADYGYYRFRLVTNHDSSIKIGGRLSIYYIADNGKEEKTFTPMYFDSDQETQQEAMGMYYIGNRITKVVWDKAQCWSY